MDKMLIIIKIMKLLQQKSNLSNKIYLVNSKANKIQPNL